MPQTFSKCRLSSASGLGAQTYVRGYEHGQPLDHIQKHFVLLALRKRDLDAWRLNSLCPQVDKQDRAVEARTPGWGHGG